MRVSSILSIMAILVAIFTMTSSGHAACSSCGGGEADWSRSADEFMDWDPKEHSPVAFGLNQAAAPNSPGVPARDAVAKADDARNYSRIISLQSINATIATVKSGGTTLITAVFAVSQSERQNQEEIQLSAQAVIRDAAGAEIERLMMVRSSADRCFSNWVADVPPGSYKVDILASSLEEEARFRDALQIEVVG